MRLALCLLLILGCGACVHAAEPGLVASWDLNEGQGTILHDASGNGNDGTIHGARWVRNKTGSCLEFDGLTSYVDCGGGPALDLRKDMSLQLWVYPSGRPLGEPGIIGKQFTSYLMTYYTDGQVYFYIGAGGNNANSPVTSDSWHHLTATFDGTNIKLYVDGRLASTRRSRFAEAATGGKFLIGCVAGAEQADDPAYRRTAFFSGLIDEAKVYNRVLAPEEIAAAARAQAPAFEITEDYHPVQPAVALQQGPVKVSLGKTGNLAITHGGQTWVMNSFFAYPGDQVGWNALAHEVTGEKAWRPAIRKQSGTRAEITARGDSTSLARSVKLDGGVVVIEDKLTNRTPEPVGVMFRHHLTVPNRLDAVTSPGTAANPTIFMHTAQGALGVVMEDGLSRLHMDSRVGARTNEASFRLMDLALDSGRSLTFRYVLMPMAPQATYFTFMNAVRNRWHSNFTIQGPFDWIDMTDPILGDPAALKTRLQRRQCQLMALSPWLDYDPGSQPRVWSRDEYKQYALKAAAALRAAQPDIKVLGCIETDWVAIDPSRIANGDKLPVFGKGSGGLNQEQMQIIEQSGLPFLDSVKRAADGTTSLELYSRGGQPQTSLSVYPALSASGQGNYQYQFLMGQVKFLLDDLGLDGYYIDEFSQAWGGSIRDYTKWDGVTVEIDPRTGRIRNRWTDCSLAGRQARVNLMKAAFDRGKVVVTNTYATSMEEQPMPANRFSETQGTFDPMLTPDGVEPPSYAPLERSNLGSMIGLGIIGRPDQHDTARRIMKAIITYLRHGMVYYHYAIEPIPETGPGSGEYGPINHMFPITPVELGEGFIRGKEHIITCISGTYRWEQPRRPQVLVFDLDGRDMSRSVAAPTLQQEGKTWLVPLKLRDWAQIAVVE